MKFRWFRYPVDGEPDLDDLNAFLATHRVISVRRDWVQGAQGSVLVFVVEFADGPSPKAGTSGVRMAGGATKDLDPQALALFNQLRDIRKQIALAEGIPVWSLFGNEALRAVVKQRPTSIAALATVPGVGKSRAAKYGEKVLEVLRDVPEKPTPASPGSAPSPEPPGKEGSAEESR